MGVCAFTKFRIDPSPPEYPVNSTPIYRPFPSGYPPSPQNSTLSRGGRGGLNSLGPNGSARARKREHNPNTTERCPPRRCHRGIAAALPHRPQKFRDGDPRKGPRVIIIRRPKYNICADKNPPYRVTITRPRVNVTSRGALGPAGRGRRAGSFGGRNFVASRRVAFPREYGKVTLEGGIYAADV